MRRRARTDKNHALIVEALRARGYLVQSLAEVGSGCPDLLCQLPDGSLELIEIKDGKGKLTPDQERFSELGWDFAIVRTVEDVMNL